jgi:hypothetical protein
MLARIRMSLLSIWAIPHLSAHASPRRSVQNVGVRGMKPRRHLGCGRDAHHDTGCGANSARIASTSEHPFNVNEVSFQMRADDGRAVIRVIRRVRGADVDLAAPEN